MKVLDLRCEVEIQGNVKYYWYDYVRDEEKIISKEKEKIQRNKIYVRKR